MIKLNYYIEDAFAFYQSIVKACRARKGRPNFREEMQALHVSQKACYATYDYHFSANTLQELVVARDTSEKWKDLQSLYDYRSKRIEKLRIALMKHPDNGRLLNTCQNCTINEVDTMDHFVPQEEFPEFAVHPKNLFPCCTACNRMKSDVWRQKSGGGRVFLNLYLDPLPTDQYLFVEFDQTWLPTFSLVQPDGLSNEIFNLIQSHYQRLKLCKRFQDRSHEIISKVAAEIRSTVRNYSAQAIQEIIKDRCAETKPLLGYNHWQLVLEEALAGNEAFIDSCLKKEI